MIKELKKQFKNILKEKTFNFTDHVEKQKEHNDKDLGLFLDISEENKIIYNQTPVNILVEDMENLKNDFFTNGYFSLGDEGEIDTNRVFKDSNELAKFVDKMLDKYDNHPSIYYTGIFYRYFRNLKRVNRSEHERGANEFNNILDYGGVSYYKPNGSGCFLKCKNYIFKNDFSMEYFESIQPYKERTNVMARCKIPEFCERYKIDIGIYDTKSKRILSGMLNRGIYVYTFIKITIVLFGRKIEKIVYLMVWKK